MESYWAFYTVISSCWASHQIGQIGLPHHSWMWPKWKYHTNCQRIKEVVERTRGNGVVFHPACVWNNLKTISIIYIIFTPPIYTTLVTKSLAFLQSSLEWKSGLLPEAAVWCRLLPLPVQPHRPGRAPPHTPSSFQLFPASLAVCSERSVPKSRDFSEGKGRVFGEGEVSLYNGA